MRYQFNIPKTLVEITQHPSGALHVTRKSDSARVRVLARGNRLLWDHSDGTLVWECEAPVDAALLLATRVEMFAHGDL